MSKKSIKRFRVAFRCHYEHKPVFWIGYDKVSKTHVFIASRAEQNALNLAVKELAKPDYRWRS
jgi:hypothetical protein